MSAMTPNEMDAVFAEHCRAEIANDLDGIVNTLTEDAEHDVVGLPTIHGRALIRERYAQQFADMDMDRLEPLRRYYGENVMVDEGLAVGRATGVVFGIPGGNRPISFRLLHVCEFRDGKIRRENVWMDVGAVVGQLTGTAPPPAP